MASIEELQFTFGFRPRQRVTRTFVVRHIVGIAELGFAAAGLLAQSKKHAIRRDGQLGKAYACRVRDRVSNDSGHWSRAGFACTLLAARYRFRRRRNLE